MINDKQKLPDLEGEDLNEEEVDSVFSDLAQEILKKRSHNDKKSPNQLKSPYFCKICGLKIENYSKIKKCIHCNISLCKECSSNGFCINCWVNMKNDARKTIKLFKLLSIGSPFLLVFLLYQAIKHMIIEGSYEKLILFFIGEIILVGFSLTSYFLSRSLINKKGSRFFDPRWENEIKTKYYLGILDPSSPKRYILKEMQKDFKRKKDYSIEKLATWIEPEAKYKDAPIPAHYQGKDTIQEIEPNVKNDKKPDTRHIKYQFIGIKCPECHEIIQFADFCPECNIKYCPECNEKNNPYNRLCLCGFVFPSLEEEYFYYVGNNEVKILQKKDTNKIDE